MPYTQVEGWLPSQIAIRTDLPVAAAADLLRTVVAAIDPGQPVESIRSADQQLWESMGRRRFHLILFGVLASVSTILALVGLYALLSFALSERRRDIGIRAALGATPGHLRWLWWRQGLTLVAVGLAIGTIGALALGGVIEGFLFGVEPRDPVALTAGAALVLVAAVGACWLPARRAASVDPIETLRTD
jgi:ABC-type antimicrobial peptide transport system permease subunit